MNEGIKYAIKSWIKAYEKKTSHEDWELAAWAYNILTDLIK